MKSNQPMANGRLRKISLHIFGFAVGIALGGFLIFQILFLMKVLPHGGF